MSEKKLVLVTNDDGYESPGIIEMASALIDEFDVLLVAPQAHHSGTGRGIPFGASYSDQGSIEKHTVPVSVDKNITAYAVDGTPALAVAHALLEIADRKPDFCISGINFGENVGQGLHYSGTIGAAMEAATQGIPTMAVSQEMHLDEILAFEGHRKLFSQAALVAKSILKRILEMPKNSDFLCLNVNIPIGATLETPIEMTHQGKQTRWEWVKPDARDFSKPFQLGCENIDGVIWEEGSDTHCVLVKRHVSITPLTYSMEETSNEIVDAAEKLTRKY